MLGHLAADRTRVAELQLQILHLEQSLHALKGERDLAQWRLDSYHYPVLDLPTEIIGEIFPQFLPVYPLRPPLIGDESPTILTQVCRAWRAIALSTPTLWRAISADYWAPLASQLEIADRWLSRSRSCPLSIEMVFLMGHPSPFLSRILEEAARVEDLKLAISASGVYTFAADLPATPMPLLRHLDLHLLAPATPLASTGLLLFRDTPQLRTVVLNDAALDIRLPWAQLSSVSLHTACPRKCAPLLKRTTNLVHCKLLMFDEAGGGIPELTLPSLQSLILKPIGNDPVIGYLDSFTLPALRNLSIANRFLGETPIDALNRFINKSGCNLQELCISGEVNDPALYRAEFPLIPRLTFGAGW
ncbi:hypothetical protein C8R46DRAFT_1009061 [Mycena filopes]|nr:hypothetical protein C8R46DRAFT_1009061 [Mycena filopes]